jgi:hypothetical protein
MAAASAARSAMVTGLGGRSCSGGWWKMGTVWSSSLARLLLSPGLWGAAGLGWDSPLVGDIWRNTTGGVIRLNILT